MPRFASYDGTMLAYDTIGAADRPLICVPGGPGRSPEYFGDLGGLSGLAILHNRGTGDSDHPDDKDSYHADRLTEDVEALRVHLGLSQMDLLGHSAGAGIAMCYAARYPERVARLILVTPGLRAAGYALTPEQWQVNVQIRRDEPWFEQAIENARNGGPLESYAQFMYGRWDETVRAHVKTGTRNPEAAQGFFDTDWPTVTQWIKAGLATLESPVLVVAGELDPGPTPQMAARVVEMVRRGNLVIQPKAGHYPWVDDPQAFAETIRHFLDG
jgi:pimeloyl-ACP methyl ester carboxylesterase